jgi:hypothetical protein
LFTSVKSWVTNDDKICGTRPPLILVFSLSLIALVRKPRPAYGLEPFKRARSIARSSPDTISHLRTDDASHIDGGGVCLIVPTSFLYRSLVSIVNPFYPPWPKGLRRRDQMPTPSIDEIVDDSRSSHTTCPPDDDRSSDWRASDTEVSQDEGLVTATTMNIQQPTPPPSDSQSANSPSHPFTGNEQHTKKLDMEGDSQSMEIVSGDMMSPVSVEDKQEEAEQPALATSQVGNSPSMSYDFSNVRVSLLIHSI